MPLSFQPNHTPGSWQRWLWFFAGVTAFAALAFAPKTVFAQGVPMIDPSSVVLTVAPGDAFVADVRVTNVGDEALALSAYVADWSFTVDGQLRFGEAGTLPGSAGDWITLQEQNITVGARSSLQLRYDVAVPDGVAPGTYWSVVFVQTEPGEPAPGQAVAAQSVRVGHVVYVNVPPLRASGAILGVFGEPPSAEGNPYVLQVQYTNSGNAVQRATPRVVVRDDLGATVIDAEFEPFVVLPGADRLLPIQLYGPLDPGNYTALVIIHFGDDDLEVAGAHDFALPDGLAEAPR